MSRIIFICSDNGKDGPLEVVSGKLRLSGVRVVQEPSNKTEILRRYSDDERAGYPAYSDVRIPPLCHDVHRKMLERAPKVAAIYYPTIVVDSDGLVVANKRGVFVAHTATVAMVSAWQRRPSC